jgi:hypothetical protein
MKPPHAQNTPDRARAWYGGKEPPHTDVLDLIEITDSETSLLYSLSVDGESGDYTERMQSLRRTLQEPWALLSYRDEMTRRN